MCVWSCVFLSFSVVSSQQRSEVMDQCYSSVTLQSFISRQQTLHHKEVRTGWPKEVASTLLGFPFWYFLSPPTVAWLVLCYEDRTCTCHPSGMCFFPTRSYHSSPGIFPVFSLSRAFLTIILDSPFFYWLPKIHTHTHTHTHTIHMCVYTHVPAFKGIEKVKNTVKKLMATT